MSKQLTRNMVLSLLAEKSLDRAWGGGQYGIHTRLQNECGGNLRAGEAMALMWQLLAEGLVYVDYTQPAPCNWLWKLTPRGQAVVGRGADFEPNDPEAYLHRLVSRVPGLDDLVRVYVEEALRAFKARCYLGSTVMVGVAAERAFQLLGEEFAKWLNGDEAERFKKVFDNPRVFYAVKFKEFRKTIEQHKPVIPSEISDNMSLNLDAVMELLRVNRNEAGHPTGKMISEDDAYVNLQLFPRFLSRLEALRDFFRMVPHPKGGLDS